MLFKILSFLVVGIGGWDKMVERRDIGLFLYDGLGKVYFMLCRFIIISVFIFWYLIVFRDGKVYK